MLPLRVIRGEYGIRGQGRGQELERAPDADERRHISAEVESALRMQ